MNTIRTRSRIFATVAISGLLLVGAPMLTGCSLAQNVVDNAVDGAVPDGIVPGQSVPDDFPSEVPLIDGDVVFALSIPEDENGKGWNVTISVSDENAFETIKSQLTDAGFEYQEISISEDISSGGFTKEPLSVIVGVTKADGKWTANYTVIKSAQ